MLTPAGEITRCNERAEQLLELPEADIEGRSFLESEWSFFDVDGSDILDSEHPFVRVRESGGPIFGQVYRLERPHADPIEVSVSGPRSRRMARSSGWSLPSRTSRTAANASVS